MYETLRKKISGDLLRCQIQGLTQKDILQSSGIIQKIIKALQLVHKKVIKSEVKR